MKKNISIALVSFFALYATAASAMALRVDAGAGVDMNQNRGEVRAGLQVQDNARIPVDIRQGIYASSTAPIRVMRTEVRDMRATTTAAIRAMRAEVQTFHASTTLQIRDMRVEMRAAFGSSTPVQRQELRLQFQEQTQALRASTTAMRANIKDEAQRMRFNVAHQQTDLVNARLTAAVDRIQTLAERTSTALDGLSAKGIDVSIARTDLADASAKLDSGRTQIAAISLSMEAAFASSTPKLALDAVRPLIKDAVTTLQAAHDYIAQAIASIRLSTTVAATTTTQ